MVNFEETSISVDWMDENPDFMGLKKHGMLKMAMLEYKQFCKKLSLKKDTYAVPNKIPVFLSIFLTALYHHL